MNQSDYKLLINICYQCLRSHNLTHKQRFDIDNILCKLYNKVFTKENFKCCGKKLKLGLKKKDTKQTEKGSKAQKTPTIIHG